MSTSVSTFRALGKLSLRPKKSIVSSSIPRLNRSRQQFPHKRYSQCRRGFATIPLRQQRFQTVVIKTQRQYPILLPVLLIATLASVSLLGVLAYDEYYKEPRRELPYSPGVERCLRDALHFTHVDKDPDQASRYFLEAISLAESEMDPFNEVAIGIRIRFAQMLEEFGRMKPAIEVLESIVRDSKEKLKELDRVSVPWNSRTATDIERGSQDDLWIQLNRLCVQCLWRIATLYDSDHVQLDSLGRAAIDEALKILVLSTPQPPPNAMADLTLNRLGLGPEVVAELLLTSGRFCLINDQLNEALAAWSLALAAARKEQGPTAKCIECHVLVNIASTMVTSAQGEFQRKSRSRPDEERVKQAYMWADQAFLVANQIQNDKSALQNEACVAVLLNVYSVRIKLLVFTGDLEEAKESYDHAMPYFEQMSHLPWAEDMRSFMAMHNLGPDFKPRSSIETHQSEEGRS